jgi:hypothetical protein
MGNDDRYGENRYGGREPNREQGREQVRDYRDGGSGGRGWNEGRREEAGWGSGGSDRGAGPRGRDDHDGGFFERAGEAARSWFGGGDHDERQRGGNGPERGTPRDNGYGESSGAGTVGGGGFGGGWGNQEGESWNRDRPGRPGWFTDSVGGERGQRPGGSGGGDHHYGAHGAGGSFEQHQRGGGGRPEQQGGGQGRPGYSPVAGDYSRGGHLHDPHYSQWRQRQIEEIDRDYDEYRREHQSKFESEFGNWRSKRQGQRQMVGQAQEKMEVLGSDGAHIGTVDKVRGDRIILTRSDPNAGGVHHSVPCSWVESVNDKVTLNRTAEQAITEWRDEDSGRALFEKPGQGSEGPHVLGRSFSGTYRDGED